MRLYLTSYQLGDHPDDLVQLTGRGNAVGIIANAGDAFPADGRAPYVQREIEDMKSLGFAAEEIDLRDWFGRQSELAVHLNRFHGLWVKGGNTFVLRRAFRHSGLDSILLDRLEDDSIVYAGYSAGAVLACPTLDGIEIMDEPEAEPEGYEPGILWDGLNLVPFNIVPHYESDHPESDFAQQCVGHLIATHVPFVALRDGETVVVNGDSTRVTSRNS